MPSTYYRQTTAPEPTPGLFVELWDPTLTTNTLARVEEADASKVSLRVWNTLTQKPGRQVHTISRQAWARRARPHGLRIFGPTQYDWVRHEPDAKPNARRSPDLLGPPMLDRMARRLDENGTPLVMSLLGGALAIGYVVKQYRGRTARWTEATI